MKSNILIEWRLFLTESKLPQIFKLKINTKEYNIIRDYHVSTPRSNSKIPRDSGMSKSKYSIILELAFDKMINDGVYSITWTTNNKNNIISLTKKDYNINIFGAIIKSETPIDKLYKKAEKRINLGEIDFKNK